ncbi:MAG: hypothetical protein Q9222_007319 [Ikaeria aurantiellina]
MRLPGTNVDIDLELSLKPILYELVRTEVCFPNIKLLVDRIDIVTVPHVDEERGNQAYKLILTDGEKTIQALLKRRIYKTIYCEDVREGSFVILKVYHLAHGKRTNGDGTVAYLVIEDFFSIGEDGRHDLDDIPEAPEFEHEELHENSESEEERTAGAGEHKPTGRDGKASQSSSQKLRAEADDTPQDENATKDLTLENASPTPPSSQQLREAMKRKWDTALDEIDTNDTYRISKYRKLEEARAREAQEAADASAKALLVRFQSLPTTPLVAITGPNKRRNTHHDVLALIVYVSADLVQRPGMPPKRELRIMDISTMKKVYLSVFANPETFQPEAGIVALFKNLTTHDYDGGSLNAYSKDCKDTEWFIPDPPGFGNGEVAQLKDCWARLQYSEQVAREQDSSQAQEPLEIAEEDDIADHLPPISGKKHLTCFYWAKNGKCRYTDDECAYAHYNTGVVAHDPMHKQNLSTEDNQDEPESFSGLPPSRSLTCFFWARNRKCNRSDEECSYAHYDTGTIARAPPGVTVFEPSDAEQITPPTKSLTCYFWNRNGRCSRSDAECAYAHHHTGTVAYAPPNVVAAAASLNTHTGAGTERSSTSSKPLTCFFWARNGHCTRSDAECTYAHYDTGVVANNPSQPLLPVSGQSKISVPSPRPVSAPAQAVSLTTTSLPPVLTPDLSTFSSPPSVQPSSTTTAATVAPPTNIDTTTASTTPSSPFPNVKHLTCYFWANFGRCKRSDRECNYAHFHTGKMAANPAELRKRR